MAAAQNPASDGSGAERRDIQGADSANSQLTISNDNQGAGSHADNNNNNSNDNASASRNGDGNINGGDPQVSRALVGSGNSSTSTASRANRPLILITDPNSSEHFARGSYAGQDNSSGSGSDLLGGGGCSADFEDDDEEEADDQFGTEHVPQRQQQSREQRQRHHHQQQQQQQQQVEEQVEEVDGIKYRIVAAVTKPALPLARSKSAGPTPTPSAGSVKRRQVGASSSNQEAPILEREENEELELAGAMSASGEQLQRANSKAQAETSGGRLVSAVRRKSSAFVSNLLQAASTFGGPGHSRSSQDLGDARRPRRLSIYEMTKSPPPETSLEIYLSERRRSSTISSKQVQQQLEQQSTFETNYCQRQQYFKDLNQKLINHDKKLLNVVANRGQIHRHSVDIAQLPLHLAAKAKASKSWGPASRARTPSGGGPTATTAARTSSARSLRLRRKNSSRASSTRAGLADQDKSNPLSAINQASAWKGAAGRRKLATDDYQETSEVEEDGDRTEEHLEDLEGNEDEEWEWEENGEGIRADDTFSEEDEDEAEVEAEDSATATRRLASARTSKRRSQGGGKLVAILEDKSLLEQKRGSVSSSRGHKKSRIVIRKFQKLDSTELSSGPAPDVKIGQRVAYKEYYGNEFGTIRWIGRVPQICPDWTVGVEFDNAIGEGDGSLNGRRYFIAKDCFAKFLPLSSVALVDQHVGRPEPGTMISVMSAAVRPGQMISIQRVSTVHVQHCFLNAPHRIPGADILAVNTRLHCQCPNCGPCAHVIKPPRTQRLARSKKNATHMCQFSTYTCCGMESQEETMCTYTGNKVVSLPPPITSSMAGLPPIGNSWIEGSGYLTQLQEQQSKLMPEEYRFGALPEDSDATVARRRLSRTSSKRSSGGHRHKRHQEADVLQHDDRKQSAETNGHDKGSSVVSAIVVGSESAQQQPQQQQQLVTNDGQTSQPPPPNYTSTNLSGSNNLRYTSNTIPSYSPSPDYSNYNKMALACPDAKEAKAAYVEPVWCEPSNICSRIEKGAKVVHRDSIENRYLFPTDEPIDSTLEADLENLSQARYGHNTSTRLSGSRNIFKSLRSLVSCLGVRSDRSELDRHSENTFRYSDHGAKGVSNKSMPAIASPATHQQYIHQHKQYQYQHQHHSSNNQQHQQRQTADYCARYNNSSPTMLEKDDKLHAHNLCNAHSDQTKQSQHSDQALRRHISSSSDCGFSSASQNSINYQSYQACSPSMSVDDERKTTQIYKQIVARLMNTTTVSNEDLLRLRKALFEPRFENFCLHGMNQNAFVSGPVEPPDQIIADIIQKSYLKQDKGYDQSMHQRSTSGYHSKTTTSAAAETNANHGFELDKLDEYFKSISFDQQQLQSSNKRPTERNDSAQTSSIMQREHSQHCNKKSTANHYQSSKPRSLIDSFTSESVTLSSHDSICGAVPVDSSDCRSNASTVEVRRKEKTKVDDAKSIDGTNLPKAFELKLTLSINSDKHTQILEEPHANAEGAVKSSSANDDLRGSSSNLLNSTFNINIVSKREEDHLDSNQKNTNSETNGEKTSRSASANCLIDSH